MCLAAYCNAGHYLSEQEVATAWSANPHGAGFAYVTDSGQLRTFRTLSLSDFQRAYYKLCEEGSAHALHLRLATHGDRTVRNAHPHKVGRYGALVHNGILPVRIDRRWSDTAVFAREYLPKLPPRWFDDTALFDLVAGYCEGSKLVYVTADPRANHRYYIVNEGAGTWDQEGGRWFSNLSHCPTRSYKAQYGATCVLCEGPLSHAPWTGRDACETCLSCADCYEQVDDCRCNGLPTWYGSRIAY